MDPPSDWSLLVPVPANVFRVNIRATVGASEEIVHTLHFKRVNTATTNEVTAQELADEVRNKWSDILTVFAVGGVNLASLLRSDLVYKTVDVYLLNALGLATTQAQATFGATAKGTNNAAPLPPEVALVVSLRTGLPGRSHRGRLYTGGFTINSVAALGLVQPATQDLLVKALDTFGQTMKMTPVGTAVDRINWIVLSRALTEANRIEEVRVGNLWDVQRRRQNQLTESYQSEQITY